MNMKVVADFRVEFLDDERERGIRVLRGRVEGAVDVAGEDEAAHVVRRAIEERFPCRWSLKIGKVAVSV